MAHPLSRRRFLELSGGLLPALGVFESLTLLSCTRAPDAPLFGISLAEWSLHRALDAGQFDHLDFPASARRDFGIEAVEYVNSYFKDKARDRAYLQELRDRCRDHGVTRHGWNHYGPGYFDLDPETGILTSHGGMGLFWYAVKPYGDFVLDLEFKCADDHTNSGIFVRVPGVPSSDDYIYHSFEIQIDMAGEGVHETGAVYDAEAPRAKAVKPAGEWNKYRITFQGNHITVELNGTTVIDWDAEPRGKVADFAASGYIGLQNHDDRSPVYFRNIYVKELESEE